jgi:enoyl-CoA hydratase/carnithine racemase
VDEIVKYTVEDHIAIISMNDPERRNPLSKEMGFALQTRIAEASKDNDIYVIVLTGSGNSFCAGGDIKEFSTFHLRPASEIHREGESTTGLFKSLSNLRKPLIGAVNGHALGGGLGLVATCHYVVASEEAKFGTTEIKLGLFPLVILPSLIDAVGPRKALEIGFTGDIFTSKEALEWGLVNQVVPSQSVLPKALAFARRLSAASPLALRVGLDCYVTTRDMEWNKKLDYANTLRVISFLSDDLREGATAFLEKRAPQWKGK